MQCEIVCDPGKPWRARCLDRGPQIIGLRVTVLVLRDIGLNAFLPHVGAGEPLEHRDDRLALFIGDRVERLIGLLDGPHRLNDRVRAGESVDFHRRVARPDMVKVGAPIGMEMLGRAARHPAGEALVKPQIVPPRHGDEIAEPLVRHFVRLDPEDGLPVAVAGDRRIVEQNPLESEDCPPIFHCAEELRLSRTGDILELGQRIRRTKILVVI